jgi:hypothetical protein
MTCISPAAAFSLHLHYTIRTVLYHIAKCAEAFPNNHHSLLLGENVDERCVPVVDLAEPAEKCWPVGYFSTV